MLKTKFCALGRNFMNIAQVVLELQKTFSTGVMYTPLSLLKL